jgi:serine/threonine-protein kinase
MPAEQLIDRACEDIADGKSVNWSLLDSQAGDDEERKRLKWLRVLEGIANLHRSHSADDSLDASLSSTNDGGDDDGPGRMPASALASPRISDSVMVEALRRVAGAGTEDLAATDLDSEADSAGLSASSSLLSSAGADPAAPQVDTWGRYHLLDQVGEGSFGSVYRAWDPQLEREIAIKILHQRWLDARLKDRLLREGRALAKIRHANVVSVFDVEAHEERVGLCMEFVRGQTLEDVLQDNGPLPARDTTLVGEDVCRALAAVHHAGFVHRDVKARNVMREANGRIVLMDFGTGREARALGESKRPDIAGTPLYMAPEVLAGSPASSRSDVYSVGVLLYHLATGAYPVEAGSVDELREAHHQGVRTPLDQRRPDLPTRFVRVVERAMARNPDERHADAAVLSVALAGVFGDPQRLRVLLTRYAIGTAVVAIAATLLPLVLGAVTSASLNAILERSGFANETLAEWWTWGIRSVVAPAVLLILARLALAFLAMTRHVVRSTSAAAARLDDRAHRGISAWAHRFSLDNVAVLSSWVVLLSAAASVVAWWYFWPLMGALGTPGISKAPLEQLALLSPANRAEHASYRQAFSAIVLLTVAAWYGVIRLSARRRDPIRRGPVFAGIIVLGLALFALDGPYRLLWHNRFEAARWNNADCYIIGERSSELLLFCPALPPPRNVTVQRRDERLQRLGRRDNIFASFSPAATSTRAATVPTQD